LFVEHDLFRKPVSTFRDHALMQLHPSAAAAGFRLLASEILPSTNTHALALARGGDRGPLWITAAQQTAGRGRRGNAWVSPSGNLYATLLLTNPAPAECAPQCSFVSALAVHDAIVACAPGLRDVLTLKWPNDVLCSGRKLAGILIEGEQASHGLAVANGIGVNVRHHPAGMSYPVTDLAAAGGDVAAENLFAALSAAMLERLGQWRRGAGFGVIRAAWLERAASIGGQMRVRLPGSELIGRCESLDEQGRLLLRLGDGSLQTIAAGEVFPVAGTASEGVSPTGRID
jgi:BirA family transcriptional regulator, biotin operon repressor / biotin---[acetyl-CoA-carboxylase] ligase